MLSSQSDEPFDEKFTLRISKVMATNGAGGWRITTKRFTRENTNKQTDAAYRVGVKAQRMLPFAYFVFHFFLQGGVSQASWRVIEAIQHFRTSVPVRFCFVDKMTSASACRVYMKFRFRPHAKTERRKNSPRNEQTETGRCYINVKINARQKRRMKWRAVWTFPQFHKVKQHARDHLELCFFLYKKVGKRWKKG